MFCYICKSCQKCCELLISCAPPALQATLPSSYNPLCLTMLGAPVCVLYKKNAAYMTGHLSRSDSYSRRGRESPADVSLEERGSWSHERRYIIRYKVAFFFIEHTHWAYYIIREYCMTIEK